MTGPVSGSINLIILDWSEDQSYVVKWPGLTLL